MHDQPAALDLAQHVGDPHGAAGRVGRLVGKDQGVFGDRGVIAPGVDDRRIDGQGQRSARLHLFLVGRVKFGPLRRAAKQARDKDVPNRGVRVHAGFDARRVVVLEGIENALDNAFDLLVQARTRQRFTHADSSSPNQCRVRVQGKRPLRAVILLV